MASEPDYPLLTAEEFLRIDFGERRAELDHGVIRMMAGGTARHAQVQGNIFVALATRLRGTGCAPYTSDMGVKTSELSVRYPDVTVFCGRGEAKDDQHKAFDDPRVIFEVLSAGTARTDLRIKLDEYKALPSVETLVFVDIATEHVRVVQRVGANSWSDEGELAGEAVPLPSLGFDLPRSELFARV